MKLRLLYHGNCFDGAASAAVFTKFYRARFYPQAKIEYVPVMHKAGNFFDKNLLSNAGENAIVDFKFCADARVTWWFDHHQSAFLNESDEQIFRDDDSGRKFLDTSSKSCAEFIARITKEKFDFADASLDELIDWAHIIDGALYESPAQCVELRAPALELMQVIEGVTDEKLIEKIIVGLTEKSIAEVLRDSEIQAQLQIILERHRKTLEEIARKATYSRGVVRFDLTDNGRDGYNKFIPYYLYPQTTYTVALTRSPQRVKISVGSNPWSPRPRAVNIAEICERYGGGGHAVVGAVSLAPDEVEKGRRFMREIIEQLQFETD